MPDDLMRDMCIQQGYVPAGCRLPGMLVLNLVNSGEDPCSGCTEDRSICGGRPKTESLTDFEKAISDAKSKLPFDPKFYQQPKPVRNDW